MFEAFLKTAEVCRMPKGVCRGHSKGKSVASRCLQLGDAMLPPPTHPVEPVLPPTNLSLGKVQSPPQSWTKGDSFSKVESELKGRKKLDKDQESRLLYAAIFHDYVFSPVKVGEAKESGGDMTLKCGIANAMELLGHSRAEDGARYGIEEEHLAWDVRHSAKKKRGGVHEARARGLESRGSGKSAVKECSKEEESSLYISEGQESGEIEKSGGIEKRHVMSEKEKMAVEGGKKGREARDRVKKESVGRGRVKKESVGHGRGKKESVGRGRGKKESVARGKGKKEKKCGPWDGENNKWGHQSSHSEPCDTEESRGVEGNEMIVERGGEAIAGASGMIAAALF